ncbi:MAG: DUF1266 domain-containing protein [Bacteroidetes bacterium]|nr:MAG: DUF1266 domain-containing protein [Bacteroidota bacterium]
MENQPLFIATLAAVAVILLLLGRRGIRRRQVMGGSGNPLTPSQGGYYLIVGGYLIGGLMVLLATLVQVQKTYGSGILTAGLVLLLLIAWAIFRLRGKKVSLLSLPQRIPSFRFRRKALKAAPAAPTPSMWPLAAAALVSGARGMDYFQLGGAPPSPRAQALAQRKLRREWEIESEDDFFETLDWLFESGHRTEFHAFIQKVSTLNPEEVRQYREEITLGMYGLDTEQEQEEELHRVEMIRSNKDNVRYISFFAWDYLRLIEICRLGFLAGYIEEDEALARMLSVSQVLQSRYDSWAEMARQFLVAREFWSCVETQKDGAQWERTLDRLAEDEQSPWKIVPFNLPLYQRKDPASGV